MTNPDAVLTFSAHTQAHVVEDQLYSMTDGSFEVVAYEVFDHPDALVEIQEAIAKRHGVDPGSTIGVWFLGPRQDVEDIVMRDYADFAEVYSAGFDPSNYIDSDEGVELIAREERETLA